ncbi:alpha/beta hydrolase family protein [Psychrobacter submarinus]|uniref:alpha/beta hydrolase family protein n=1 Tax=Psychrobacter submarinus TaxID=154108 RepID=UPI003F69DFCD
MTIPHANLSKIPTMSRCLLSVAVASSLLLTACGDDDNDFNAPISTESPTTSEFINAFSQDQIDTLIGDTADTPDAECGVTIEKVSYPTVGAAGEATNATAALMLPTGDSDECQGERPVLLYAHGTTTDRGYDFTQVGNVNNPAVGESTLIAANFAAQGYIVVAPNYAGYDDSELDYHPYLVAEQQSNDMVDALESARAVIDKQKLANNDNYTNIDDSGKLYLSGYSQGGHVAMATARLLESQNKTVTAIAPLSGPYALAAFGDEIFKGNVNIGASRFAPLLGIGLKEKYTNIYEQPSDIFLDKYADVRLPSNTAFGKLVAAGEVPNNALFENNPSNPALAGLGKGAIFSILGGYDDSDYLIKTDFRAAYVTDTANNPDGLVVADSDNLPAANPQNNLRKALKDNDLRGYVPTMPTLLCGGNQDPTVYFDTNTGSMAGLLQAANASDPAAKLNITVLDVDKDNEESRPDKTTLITIGQASMNTWDVNDVVDSVQTRFSNSVQQVKDDATAQGANPLLAFYSSYHGSLVSSACTQATREFFDQDFSASQVVPR